MSRIREWLGTFGDAASIAGLFGVTMPTAIAATAGIWAEVEKLRASYILIVFVIVFAGSLWSWIGLIWLFDRAKKVNPTHLESERKALDCAWGLILENAVLRFDANNEVERQVAVSFRNTLPWPIRAEIVTRFLEIENTTPDMNMTHPLTPFIVMPNQPISMNFPGYSKGKIPEKERIKGKIDIVVKYGHPDGGYSRIMSRWWHFDQPMKPSIPEGMFPGMVMMPLPQVPISAGPYKEDEDKPYTEQKIINPPKQA